MLTPEQAIRQLKERQKPDIERQIKLVEALVHEARQENGSGKALSPLANSTSGREILLEESVYLEVQIRIRELGCTPETYIISGEPRTCIKF